MRRSTALGGGMRLGISAAVPVFVLGVTFGAAARLAGWDGVTACVFSALAFSGSAQFTLLAALSSGTAVAAVTAAVLINARYLIMSVALNGSLSGGRLRRALHAQALVDASFALAHRGDGRFDLPRLVGASVSQWLAWVTGTVIGALTVPSADFVHRLGLDTAFPAFFLVLAMEEVRGSRRAVLAATAGAALAGSMLLVTSTANAVLIATTAVLVGLVPPRRKRQGGADADLA